MRAHEITSDGKTVWVNCGETGINLGRFSRWGMDIHRDYQGQLNGATVCIGCTHTRPTDKEWENFMALMEKYHGVKIDPTHRPTFLNENKETA